MHGAIWDMLAFEDDWGCIQYKMLNRPQIAHFLYKYLPLIDEHNKQCQNLLNLERKWCTKDCWFWLVTTLVGMSMVDMHSCWCRITRVSVKLREMACMNLLFMSSVIICAIV
jgi:hypothetical protein